MSSTTYQPPRTPIKRQRSPSDPSLYNIERPGSAMMRLEASNAELSAENAHLKTQVNLLNNSLNDLKGTTVKLNLQRRDMIKQNTLLGQKNIKLEDQLLFAHAELVWATREVSNLNRLLEAAAAEKGAGDEVVGVDSASLSAPEQSSDLALARLPVSHHSRATREMTSTAASSIPDVHPDTEASILASGAEIASMFQQVNKKGGVASKRRTRKGDGDGEAVEMKIAGRDPRRIKRQKVTREPEGPYGGGYV